MKLPSTDGTVWPMPTPAETTRPWAYLSWPNRITLLRLALVAPFFVLMQHHQARPDYRYLALVIFMFMALSDLADGFLARRLDRKTHLGALLDALADKTLIICAAVLLSLPHSAVRDTRLPDWVVVVIVGKDLWVMVGFVLVFLLTGRVRISPSVTGKLCTCAQLVMVASVLLSPELNMLGRQAGSRLALGLWWTVAALCVVSVISYTRMGVSFMAEADHENRGDSRDKAA